MALESEQFLLQFHSSGPVRLLHLQRYFATAWQRDRCWERMESGAARWAMMVGGRVRELANTRALPSLQLFRNLLSTAPPHSLPLWHVAARFNAFTGIGTTADVLAIVKAASNRAPFSWDCRELQNAVDSICNGQASPVESDVAPLAADNWIGQVAMKMSLCKSFGADDLVQLLSSFDLRERKRVSRKIDDLISSLCAQLVMFPSARLTRTHLKQLDPLLHDKLKGPFLEAVLVDGTLKREENRRNNKLKKEETRQFQIQENRRLLSEAFHSLSGAVVANGRCASQWSKFAETIIGFGEHNDAAEIFSIIPQLTQSIQLGLHTLRSAPKSVALALDRFAGNCLFDALRIWAAPVKKRVEVFEELKSLESISLLWIDYFYQCDRTKFSQTRSAKVRAKIWQKWKVNRVQLGACFSSCVGMKDSDVDLVLEWISMFPATEHVKMMTAEGVLCQFVLAERRFVSSLRLMFGAELGLGGLACKLINQATALKWKKCCSINRAKEFGELWDRVGEWNRGESPNLSWPCTRGRHGFIVSVFKELPIEKLVAALGSELRLEDVADLIRLWSRHNTNSKAAGFLVRLEVDNQPAWSQIVSEKTLASARTLKSIWAMLLEADKNLAIEAAIRWPKYFAQSAVDQIGVELLLPTALRSNELACLIEDNFSQESLIEAIDTVQKSMQGTPLKQAILEIAILSSLRDIRYIGHLARISMRRKESHKRGHRFDDLYKVYELPKRAGGTRTITAPQPLLKRLQRRLLANGLNSLDVHRAAHGFRRDHSIATNAAVHVGKRIVVNVDIEGFFQNTKYQSILDTVRKLGGGKLSDPADFLLADICSYNGALPTGAPTSPAIGNIVLRAADTAIASVAERSGIAFTRYADDLTFSGDDNTKQILPFVRKVLAKSGFSLDNKKTQLYRRGRQQLVTNLIVNDKVNLKRIDRRRLRAVIDARCAGRPVTWHDRPMSDSKIQGWIALLNIIDRTAAAKLSAKLQSSAPNWRKGREYPPM